MVFVKGIIQKIFFNFKIVGIFSSKKNFLGIDVGNYSIKVVELSKENTPRLVTYGFIDQAPEIIKSDFKEAMATTVDLLKKICKKANVTTNKVAAALPVFSVFSSLINLPTMPKKELASAVRWEAKKFIPMPLQEMILEWKVVEESKPSSNKQPAQSKQDKKKSSIVEPGNTKILLTAAPKKLVQRYIDIFKMTGLELIGLETEIFSLQRAMMGGDNVSTVVILDMGAVTSDICVIKKGIPVLTRSIDVGGIAITKAIADSLNIDLKRAEQFKRDIGIQSGTNSQIPKTIESVLDPVINEIKHVFNIYRSQSFDGEIEKVIISGGSAFLPNFSEYLSEALDVKTYIGDSWNQIAYPAELKPILNEIGPRFSIANGLALRSML